MEPVFKPKSYVQANGIFYRGLLQGNKLKSKECLAPIFEAITNSLEACKISINVVKKYINVKIYSNSDIAEGAVFNKLVIEDNGIGFNDENFKRFTIYKDTRKSIFNNGSGRIQYLMFFKTTNFYSIYSTEENKKCRTFKLSKSNDFLDNDSITYCEDEENLDKIVEDFTSITFNGLWDKHDENFYNVLTADSLKKQVIDRYLQYFCLNKSSMPEIKIIQYIDGVEEKELLISNEDIPDYNKSEKISVNYRTENDQGKIYSSNKCEEFGLLSFVLPGKILDRNSINLTIKDEILKHQEIKFDYLDKRDEINGKRYLILVSSNYLNHLDHDIRGDLKLLTLKEFEQNRELFKGEYIVVEDLTTRINAKIKDWYPEILQKKQDHDNEINKLQEMFLLDKDFLSKAKININSSNFEILKQVYEHDADLAAKGDAEIKNAIDTIDMLNPSDPQEYINGLANITKKIVAKIPLQNRTALAHYVARRKLVLDLFNKILDKQLAIQQNTERNIDEKLLHDLLFKQSSSDISSSDLWLINEDFIYFSGASDKKLSTITINNEPLLKSDELLSSEEKDYKYGLGIDEGNKKPDILLFPDEGKCILIEFKNPNKNAAEHLTEISNYASLILNLSQDKFKIDTFYGYLIGENISTKQVQAHDSDFKISSQFEYLFRPSKTVLGFNRPHGDLYMEVINYSTLLKRAKVRNKVFIDKLNLNSEKSSKK